MSMLHGLYVSSVVQVCEDHVLSGSGDSKVRLWQTSTEKLVGELAIHQDEVFNIVRIVNYEDAVSGLSISSLSDPGALSVPARKTAATKGLANFKQHYFASASYDNTIMIFMVMENIIEAKDGSGPRSKCSSPVLVKLLDGLWTGQIVSLNEGEVFAGTSEGGYVQLIDRKTARPPADKEKKKLFKIREKRNSRADDTILSTLFTKSRLELEIPSNLPLCLTPVPINEDEYMENLAVGYRLGDVVVWNWKEPRKVHHIQAHTDEVRALASFDDGRVASVGDDKHLKVWRGAKCVQDMRFDFLLSAVATSGRTSCAVGAKNGDIYLVNVKNGALLHTISAQKRCVENGIRSIVFVRSPAESDKEAVRLVIGSNDRTIKALLIRPNVTRRFSMIEDLSSDFSSMMRESTVTV
eukprot:CAMPEP_0185830986 /NCGR_PEP_ID=MMETSP1353-20130828/1206_1 /TAXON_ID=1077150 /ORGANISM="Erythrolobus australicus, Strain CCMP3124" /LENGTH=409 /DNA_ID=CAMNT_0028528989 /DNA_START=99 /DNA_END=1328 /DNA_ORIENTATION=+